MPFISKYFVFPGDKFGSWTVLNLVKNARSLCKCICGLERIVNNADLVTSRSLSCGKRICRGRFNDLIGLRFGFLTVTERTNQQASNGSIIWKCICICGKVCLVPSKHLATGGTKSCGCKRVELKNSKLSILSDQDRIINKVLDSYKRGALRRELNFELTREEFSKLIIDNCYYCGSCPINEVRIKKYDQNIVMLVNGVDRVDNSIGYISENCVPCCKICNRAKLNMSIADFEAWLKKIRS